MNCPYLRIRVSAIVCVSPDSFKLQNPFNSKAEAVMAAVVTEPSRSAGYAYAATNWGASQ
ncbi:hypothetical protein [Nostoc sp.]|uniref:hypothetical protein n=1 Tax=Nostoc sp. TaxID=1180 RepID=UPI002FF68211